MTLQYLLAGLSLLYFGQILLFLVGLRRIRAGSGNSEQPFVSIVVAARNEEQNLRECLNSILRQSYQPQMYEVIVANDHSTDGTGAICDAYARTHDNVQPFVPELGSALPGKTNALAQAIDRASGEIVMITDADCVVPPTWIETTVQQYAPQVGIVGGMAIQESRNSFEGMQALDWAYLLGIAAAAVALKNPLSTIGNNLSFRKKAYEEVGGYRNIPFSVTEDYTLFQAILGTGHWEARYPVDPRLLVLSKPCPTLRDLVRQKHRWGKGGLDMKLSGFAIMAIGFSTHAAILFAATTGAFLYAAAVFLFKMTCDYAFINSVLSRLQRKEVIKYFYPFQLYYFFYVLVLPFIVLFSGKVAWKGRSY